MTKRHLFRLLAAWRALAILMAIAAVTGVAAAAVPTRDQAILNQRTVTSTVKLQLLDTTKKTETNTKGIRCATTTGQRGTTRDTSQPVVPNGGDQRIQQYDPTIRRAPDSGSGPTGIPNVNSGRNAQQRALMNDTSTVIGGIDTQASIIPETQQQYRQMAQGVGTAPTVMGALDQNSAVRVQNGLTWNQATQSANLLVQALNAANLFHVGQLSASAGGMATGLPSLAPTGGWSMCVAGYSGRGTAEDPCRPAGSICSTTPPGVVPDPNCVSQRYVDRSGNVAVYLGSVQDSSLTALVTTPSASVFPPVQPQPSAADITAALQTGR